ncbi:MAG: hypothetical protein ACFFDF_12310 [Candidatus Odinarchaeota archaeon]
MENSEIKQSWDRDSKIQLSESYGGLFSKLVRRLKLSKVHNLRLECEEVFQEIYFKCKNPSKYEHPKYLIPLIIYIVLKRYGTNIRKSDLMLKSHLNPKEFNETYKRILSKGKSWKSANDRFFQKKLEIPIEFLREIKKNHCIKIL